MAKKKPDVNEIKAMEIERKEKYYSKMRENFLLCKDYYDGNIPVPVPKGFEKYVPPTARAIVDVLVDNYITQNPMVTVDRKSDKDVEQQHADKMEKFYNAIMRENALRNVMPPEREGAKQLGIYGMCAFKGPYIDYRYKSDGKDSDLFPFRYKAINVFSILPSPSFFWEGHGDVIESYEKTVGEVRLLWPKYKGGSKKDSEIVKCLQYTNDDYIINIVDDEEVNAKINKFGFIPYKIGFNGMGLLTDKPEDMAVGILLPVISSLKLEARMKSAADAIMQVVAYPILKTNVNPNTLKLEITPGFLNYVPDDTKVEPLYELKIPNDVYQNIGMVRDDIEHATMSKVIYGERPPGVTSGYHQRALTSQVQLKFQQGISTLQNNLSEILGNCAKLMENIMPEPITIWGQLPTGYYEETIKPEEIKGYYRCKVKLESTKPEENERKSLSGLEIYNAGAMSLKRYHEEYAGVADHTSEFKQMLVEGIMKQPPILEALAKAAVKDWGLEEYITAEKENAQAGGGQPGQPTPASVMGMPIGNVAQPAEPGSFEEQELLRRQMGVA